MNSRSSLPPGAWTPLYRLAKLARKPLETFLRIEAASGVLLMVFAALAIIWVNSPWRESYESLWNTEVGIAIGSFELQKSLAWLVNDCLMAVFFFVVGLEIRREIHHGELSEWRRAALPVAAALGGMIVPALLYTAFAGGVNTSHGWGVPMATDIAFAVGVLTLLGKRVPPALRVLLLALAVIDDLGAIVVIAIFYSEGIAWWGFGLAACGFGMIIALQWVGVRAKLAYVAPGILAWAGIYAAGVHPTIAGVIIGLMTPVRTWLTTEEFVERVRRDIDDLASRKVEELEPHALAVRLADIDEARREAMSPAEQLIAVLHPWVAFVIMPVFALANAGVSLSGFSLSGDSGVVVTGVAVGLVVGKPIGVFAACWLATKSKLCKLPVGITARHLVVLGTCAGIGFTMSLFIAQLAFASPALLASAKVGILAASVLSALIALGLGAVLLSKAGTEGAAKSADEAETETAR